jgi:adenylate kinase
MAAASSSDKKYRAILLFGMPGSGKGTQGQILGQLPDLVHISCGDIFRKLPKHGELYKEVLQYTSVGQLVPDDLTVRIWHRYIQVMEMQELLIPDYHILVLDGLPRNYAQAQKVDGFLEVIQIFNLEINDTAKAVERLKARALRENRLDDSNDGVILRRMKTYHDETATTLGFYDPKLITNVDASRTPIDVLRQIIDRLAELADRREHDREAVELPGDLVHSGI